MDKKRFIKACDKIINKDRETNGIGTLGEKSLHAVLKHYFEPSIENHEIKIDRFVADIKGEKGIYEIQTRAFEKLRKKLSKFLEDTKVTIVYPIAHIKWLIWIDENTGEMTKKRKSPKKGTPYDIFFELYKIKSFLAHKNINLCIVMIDMEEYRNLNGWSKDKKKGSSRYDRIPIEIIDEIYIESVSEYIKLIPDSIPEEFISKDFKKGTGLTLRNAQTALNVLNHIGAVKRIDKKGNAFVYRRV